MQSKKSLDRKEAVAEYTREWQEDGHWNDYSIDEVVNKIYDDFEARICKNCKFYNMDDFLCNAIPESDSWIQDALDRIVPNAQFCPDENFGCNKFEMRGDK